MKKAFPPLRAKECLFYLLRVKKWNCFNALLGFQGQGPCRRGRLVIWQKQVLQIYNRRSYF